MQHFGLRGRIGSIFSKGVADRASENWSKTKKMDPKFASEKENDHLQLQNRSQGVWERFGMALDPKVPYQISKNIDFGVWSVALFSYDQDFAIVPR